MTRSFKHTDAQRRRMFALLKYLGWNIEDLRDLVEAKTGYRHISALTTIGASDVLHDLQGLVQEARSDQPQPSPKQVKKIYKLGYLLRWNSRTIREFNQRTTGNWDIYENTTVETSKLINAMEGVLASERQRLVHA